MPLFFDEEIGARDCGEDVKWSDLTPSAAASSEDGEMDDTSGGCQFTASAALVVRSTADQSRTVPIKDGATEHKETWHRDSEVHSSKSTGLQMALLTRLEFENGREHGRRRRTSCLYIEVLEHELYQQWCDESGSDNSLPTVEIGVEANRLQQTPTARAAFNAVHDICTSGQAFVDNWTPADENEIEEQQKRFSKYSQHAISFAIATFSGFVISESSSSANTAVKVVAVAALRKPRLRQVPQSSPSAKNRALGEEGFAKCLALGEASIWRRRLRQVLSTRRRNALGEIASSPSAKHSAKKGTWRSLTASIPIPCHRLRQVPPSGT
ncbi:uncharacterized protein LOC110432617 [Sorghum bicolor]|uniref:uncharacterized protein LOC110432617 n=1 Tax=Sorghum bicolor TaxID=4558 RepID=UPI000B425200|nr:uncharacterized protein LOC110432617 [Sorghum bicolor]|eukprot:XP_021309054.1 uncharacterized protein LOC110432617 [Sorghum bicolor]